MSIKRSFFPHLVVGQAKKVSQDFISSNLISFQGTSTVLSAVEQGVADEQSLGEIQLSIESLITSGSVVSDKTEFLDFFADFEAKLEEVNNYDGVDENFSVTISQESIGHLDKYWDWLFAYYVLNTNPALQHDLISAIKLVSLATSSMIGSVIADWWRKSTVILPNPPFPLQNSVVNEINDPNPVIPDESVVLSAEIERLSSAREEILLVFDNQIQADKLEKLDQTKYTDILDKSTAETFEGTSTQSSTVDPNAIYAEYLNSKNGEELSTTSVQLLTENTTSALNDYNIENVKINVPYTLKRIEKEINALMAKYPFSPAESHLVVLGESILTIDEAIYNEIICSEDNSLSHCALLHQLNENIPDREYVQILGVGHANIIRQEIVRHEATEIAHIENVLQGEHRHKTHRNLKTREEFSYSETEKNDETETDMKTTNRFELSKEVSTINQEDEQFQAGVNVSYYGPVSVQANASYATGSSNSEINSSSLQLSKELTERAISRIQERSLEIRESRSINEVEVTNEHHINNEAGTDHINGFYYWVDKVYSNQVYNIGKRLMLEFMIPEPAAYHIFSNLKQPKQGETLAKPIHPREYKGNGIDTPLKSFNDLSRDNYQLWAAKYGAQNITPPPSEILTVANAYSLDYLPEGKTWNDLSFKDLTVPEGYQAEKGILSINTSHGSGRYMKGFLGNQPFFTNGATAMPLEVTLSQETDVVPLSFRGHFSEYAMNVEVICKLSQSGFDKWRIETYNGILGAYEALRIDFESQLGQMETAIAIKGQNPRLNRETEKLELKKWALELLTLQRFDGFDAMKRASNFAPEIDFEEALVEGQFVKFFEQAIEWQNMTYLFYPYFWGHKQRWTTLKQLGDTDEKFTKFLQAGYARVVVPVHPKFTEAMLHYLRSGEIWNGENLPGLDDEMYLSIVQEIKEMEDNTGGKEVGDPWETRVPTNLVMINSDIPNNLPGS